tara:strand:+ start:118 stop:291 length:174 start_codon:yes stop_codon:yes gene_type:complete
MTTLTYRGKAYTQNKEASKKKLVELTYRSSVYKSRQNAASSSNETANLSYRGISYKK